jgi:hypothetical protein
MKRRRLYTPFVFAVEALSRLVADGWNITHAENAEGDELATPSVMGSIRHTEATEGGYIRMAKDTRNASLVVLWGNTNPEEVFSDFSASNAETLDEIAKVLDTLADSLDEEV